MAGLDAFLGAKSATMQQGQQMMAMEQAVQKIQRDKQLKSILAQSYSPATGAIPAMPQAPAMGAMHQGATPLPDYPAQAAVAAQSGKFDISGAQQQLMAGGFLPEAMQMEGFKPKPKAGFTLGEGQNRYDAAGNIIARGREKKGAGSGLTKGQEAVDRSFAKEYVTFTASGGYADIQKQLSQLDEVFNALGTYETDPKTGKQVYKEGAKNLTGGVLGRTPDFMLAMSHPEAIAARDTVEEVVQRNLRLILGAQFTEKEGERLIARAYNPKLGEEENKKRLGRLIKQIKTAAEQKQRASEYFEANGTLTGFKGHIPTLSDFDGQTVPRGTNKAALNWANANHNDPRAMQILQRLGR